VDDSALGKGRVGSRLQRHALMALEKRRVFGFLVAVTTVIAIVTGLVAHLIDDKDFPTFGTGLWWAIVTLGTVGYGDVVPHTAWGRVLGGVVIVFGVTFISFLVAIVTSLFVDSTNAGDTRRREAQHDETMALLRDIAARLAAIEAGSGKPS
jgi:voltage-gated potassium channel